MARRSPLRNNADETLNEDASFSTLSSIDLNIAESLETDPAFRERYLRRWAANEVSTELRAMRLKRELKQTALASRAKTGQSAISRIEKQNYDGWTFKTLLTIAMALNARLSIKLEPIEDIIQRFKPNESSAIVEEDVGGTAGRAAVQGGGATPQEAWAQQSVERTSDLAVM
jgi:transcriptional regulator with XRE-family HTH domain